MRVDVEGAASGWRSVGRRRRWPGLRSGACRARWLERERQLIVGEPDRHRTAAFELAKEDLVREPVAYLGLDDAAQRARAIDGVVPLLAEPRPSLGLEADRHFPLAQLRLELQDEFLDDRFHHIR